MRSKKLNPRLFVANVLLIKRVNALENVIKRVKSNASKPFHYKHFVGYVSKINTFKKYINLRSS